MSRIKVTSKNQSGGINAGRVNSASINIKSKIVTRQRTEGFFIGIVAAVVAGVVVELIKIWLF